MKHFIACGILCVLAAADIASAQNPASNKAFFVAGLNELTCHGG
jgi:hypothetical protein